MRKIIIFLLCLVVHLMARGQTNTIDYRYWFDEESDVVTTGQFSDSDFHLDIPTDGLDDRLHYLHIQVCDTAGVWGAPITRQFQKMMNYPDAPILYHIWHSEDIDNTISGTYTGDTLHLDVSQLSEGPHHVYVQASQNGRYSVPIEKLFYVLPNMETMDYLFCMINIDGEPYRLERVPMSSGAISWVLDMDSLATGIHRYTIMAITPTGAATSIKEGFFVRDNMASQLAHQRCCYQVDGGEAVVTDGTLTNGQYHFDLDMSDISNGLHKLSYWLLSDNGTTTEVRTSLFIKIPLGGTGVKAYDYWLNEDFDNRHTTTLAKQQDPFKLISLLPVETVPLRSCNFKFAFKNDTPVTYARNEFHIRFLDAGGRHVETTKQFVDEKVWEEVTPVGELQPTQTFDRVEENGIRWYTVTVNEGDTVAFMSNQACTLQLFSPSGEEVYQASGDKSVAFGGCHTWETGTYYLAVHDVTGTKPTMTLDYMHMDKYDIVSQDVYIVGNGGCSTITFKGNGFRDLYAVVLTNEEGETIESMKIGNESDAVTGVTFDFDGVALGLYNAMFYFENGEKEIVNCLTVEEAIPFEFEETASFASTFLLGQKNDYVFKVTNKSNMTAYEVPLAIYIYTPDSASLTSVKIHGYDVKNDLVRMLGDNYTDSLANVIKEKEKISDDLYYFLEDYDDEYVTGHPYLHYAFISPTLPPNSTKTVTISVKTTNSVFVYMWYPIEWGKGVNNAREKIKRAGAMDGICAIANEKNRQCTENQNMIELGLSPIYNVDCSKYHKIPKSCTQPPGGGSNGRQSYDPNEIYGTTSPSGSIYLTDSIKTVNYRIQFENDSVIATAAAQTVIVRDTLGTQYYDLSTFSPTFVKIADEMYELDGSPNFVKTIDMRPRIYTIVQVEGQLDEEKGIATWTFKSLDPMTMEPTTYVERGFLPVNTDGISGIGEVAFDIDLKQPLPNGTEISTRSGNVFDSNDPVMTPYWTNIIDAVAPESYITTYEMANDSTMTLHFDGTDNLSGVWKYDVYVCYGEKAAPFKVAEDVTENECDVHVYPGIVHGFFVVATDSAGNMERKSLPELIVPMGYTRGDANCDGSVNVTDVMTVVSQIMGYPVDAYCRENADTNDDGDVNITDVMEIVNIILGAPRTDAPHNARVATNEQLQISASGKRCSLRLEGDEHYTGCQLLVRLPEKCVLRSIATGGQKDTTVEYRDLGHGLYSVLTYSPDGIELPTNDLPLLDLIIDGDYARGLEVSGLQLTNRQLETVVLDGSAASPTGIFTINMDSPSSRTYDTRGMEVETPTRGVYIQQGKKVVVH